jgi:hypothetical protein
MPGLVRNVCDKWHTKQSVGSDKPAVGKSDRYDESNGGHDLQPNKTMPPRPRTIPCPSNPSGDDPSNPTDDILGATGARGRNVSTRTRGGKRKWRKKPKRRTWRRARSHAICRPHSVGRMWRRAPSPSRRKGNTDAEMRQPSKLERVQNTQQLERLFLLRV